MIEKTPEEQKLNNNNKENKEKVMTKELTVEILYNSDQKARIFMGGDTSNPSWEEYVDGFEDKYKQHVILLKEALAKHGYIGATGEDQQRFGITFMFSDGEHWSFTWRAWGDLMQAIIDKREGYMAYYM